MPTYRTSDPARWGAGKEANLTAGEIDANFWELAERIAGVEGNAPEPNNIASITVVGTQMTIHLQDGTTLGPYTLPSAMIHFRGDWIAGTAYVEMDIVAAPDARGLYLVRRAHTAPAAFDPTATDASGNLLYRWVLPMTGSRLGDLSDVSLMAPADGQYLGWNGSTWLPRDVAASLSGLQDVLIGTLADGEVLTWDAASGIWVNAAPSGGGGAAQHRWRLVLRETFAAGTWFNPAEIEFRETAGVARSATDGAPFTDPNTTWWSPENAFDGNLTNYVSGDAPASGAYIGVGFPVYMTFVEVAIKVYNCTLDDFDIQHSTDGLLWETLAQVRGAGITSGTSVSAWYTFALAAPATGGGGGTATFLELTDTPAAYGAAGQLAAMNGVGDGLVFIDPPTGGGLADAPTDGTVYGRLDGAWTAIDFVASWADIPDIPATVDALPAAIGAEGQILKVQAGGTIAWAADETATGGTSGSLNDLSDVTLTTPATGNLLRYDGASWINGAVDWAEVGGRPATFPPDAHTHPAAEVSDFAEAVDDRVAALLVGGTNITLTYDDAADSLTINAAGGGASAINDLSDVDTATVAPTGGQALVWDATNLVWEPGTVGGGGGASVSDEGLQILAGPSDVNFAGAGVSVADDGDGTVTVTIEGAPAEPDLTFETNTSTTYSTSAYAAKGNILTIERDAVLRSVSLPIETDPGSTYKLVIALVSGATAVIDEILVDTPSRAVAAQGTYTFDFADLFLRAGQRIAIMAVRTDGTATAPCELVFPSAAMVGNDYWTPFGAIRYASNDPLVGDATIYSGNTTNVRMTLTYAPDFRDAPADGSMYARMDGSWTPFALPGAYRYWRLRLISEDQMSDSTEVRIGDIEFRTEAGVPEVAAGGTAFGDFSNIANAFDGSTSNNATLAEPYTGRFIGYDFGGPKVIEETVVKSGNNLAARAPSRFVIEASNDNETYVEVARADPVDPLWSGFGTVERAFAVTIPVDADSLVGVTPSAFALTLLDDANAAAARATLDAAQGKPPVEDVAGTAYTQGAADAGKWKRTTDGTGITVTVAASVNAAHEEITFLQGGAGAITFAAGAGLTLSSRGGALASAGQHAVCGVKFTSATEAVLFGDIA